VAGMAALQIGAGQSRGQLFLRAVRRPSFRKPIP
jgi:hypothetical protein